MPVKYRSGATFDFIEDCLATGRVAFSLAECMSSTGLGKEAAMAQLRRLRPSVVPLYARAHFYLIVEPRYRIFGAPPPALWLDHYFRTRGRTYYLGLLSAAAEYGSSHQASQVTQVIVAESRPSIAVGRVRVEITVKQDISETPVAIAFNAEAPLRVSSPPATVLDLIRYNAKVGGIDRVVDIINDMKSRIAVGDLKLALTQDLEIKLLQRTGFIFEHLGLERHAGVIEDRLQGLRLQPTTLSSTRPRAEVVSRNRWNVVATLGLSRS